MMRAGSDFSIIGSETSKERELGSDFDCLDDGARSIRSFVLSSEVCVEEVKEIGQVKVDKPEVKAEDKPKEKSEEKPMKKLEEQPEKKVEVVPTESATVVEKVPEGQGAAEEERKPEEKEAKEEVKAPEETKTSEEKKEEAPKEKETSKPKEDVKIVIEPSEEQSAPLLVAEKKTNEVETNKLPAPIARSIFEDAGEPVYTLPSSVLMEYGITEEPEERGPTFRERVQRWRRSIRQKIDYLTQENEYDDNPTLKEIIVDLWHKEIRGFTISRTTDFLCLLLPFCMLAVVFSAPENFLYTMLTICSIWVLWRWCCIPRPEKRRTGYRY